MSKIHCCEICLELRDSNIKEPVGLLIFGTQLFVALTVTIPFDLAISSQDHITLLFLWHHSHSWHTLSHKTHTHS